MKRLDTPVSGAFDEFVLHDYADGGGNYQQYGHKPALIVEQLLYVFSRWVLNTLVLI